MFNVCFMEQDSCECSLLVWASFLIFFFLMLGHFYVWENKSRLENELQETFGDSRHISWPDKSMNHEGHPIFVILQNDIDALRNYQIFHYLSFVVSPFVVCVLHRFRFLPGTTVFPWHYAVAFGLLTLCILVTTLILSSRIATPFPMINLPHLLDYGSGYDLKTLSDSQRSLLRTTYRLSYDVKMLYVVDALHSLGMATLFVFCGFLIVSVDIGASLTFRHVLLVATAFVLLVAVFVLLPFFFSRYKTLHATVAAIEARSAQPQSGDFRIMCEKDLLAIRPVYPYSDSLKFLWFTLTGGGIVTILLSKALKDLVK